MEWGWNRRRLAEAPLRGGRACDRDGHATGGVSVGLLRAAVRLGGWKPPPRVGGHATGTVTPLGGWSWWRGLRGWLQGRGSTVVYRDLPVSRRREEILSAMRKSRAVVVVEFV